MTKHNTKPMIKNISYRGTEITIRVTPYIVPSNEVYCICTWYLNGDKPSADADHNEHRGKLDTLAEVLLKFQKDAKETVDRSFEIHGKLENARKILDQFELVTEPKG